MLWLFHQHKWNNAQLLLPLATFVRISHLIWNIYLKELQLDIVPKGELMDVNLLFLQRTGKQAKQFFTHLWKYIHQMKLIHSLLFLKAWRISFTNTTIFQILAQVTNFLLSMVLICNKMRITNWWIMSQTATANPVKVTRKFTLIMNLILTWHLRIVTFFYSSWYQSESSKMDW